MTVQFEQFDVKNGARAIPFVPKRRRPGFYRNGLKRAMDIAFVITTLPIFLPVISLLIVLVAAQGGKPIYRSQRVGKDGKVFGMIKLRTMVADADLELDRHLAQDPLAMAEWSRTQKLKNDPRITKLGKILRKTSLDELPQLWNVLVGDMSLVGPRPMLPEQQGLYPGIAYYSLRPGMTGTWQVSSRNESEFSERSEYDQAYDASLSLHLDIKVLFQTIGVVFRGTGY